MSLSKKMASRSWARGMDSRNDTAAACESLSCVIMLPLVSSSSPTSRARRSSWPGSTARPKSWIFCGRPFSDTSKSSTLRSGTRCPAASWTVTVRCTSLRCAGKTGAGGWSAAAQTRGAATATATAARRLDLSRMGTRYGHHLTSPRGRGRAGRDRLHSSPPHSAQPAGQRARAARPLLEPVFLLAHLALEGRELPPPGGELRLARRRRGPVARAAAAGAPGTGEARTRLPVGDARAEGLHARKTGAKTVVKLRGFAPPVALASPVSLAGIRMHARRCRRGRRHAIGARVDAGLAAVL